MKEYKGGIKMTEKKDKFEYNLVKLTPKELIEAQLNKDKIEIDLMNAEGKLEIQKFKIEHNIPQYELNEDVENIENSIKKIKESKDKLDKKDPRYEEKVICHDYDVFCGLKELELAKLKAKKNMGARMANEAIAVLEGRIPIHKDNLKLFKDQIRNKTRKEPIIQEQIQLDEEEQIE